jgi:MFS family permease
MRGHGHDGGQEGHEWPDQLLHGQAADGHAEEETQTDRWERSGPFCLGPPAFRAIPTRVSSTLLGWLAFQFTDSPFMVAVAAFARSTPMMLLGPFTGLVADRMHRGRVLVFTQALGLATALALAAVFAAGRGGFWPMVGLEVLLGALWALDFPARRAAWPPRSRSRPSRVGPTVNPV